MPKSAYFGCTVKKISSQDILVLHGALYNILRNLEFTLRAMDSPERSSSKMHPKYITFLCWDYANIFHIVLSLSTFFKRLFVPKTIDLVLSSRKWMLSLFSINQSHKELKFLFMLFSIDFFYQ